MNLQQSGIESATRSPYNPQPRISLPPYDSLSAQPYCSPPLIQSASYGANSDREWTYGGVTTPAVHVAVASPSLAIWTDSVDIGRLELSAYAADDCDLNAVPFPHQSGYNPPHQYPPMGFDNGASTTLGMASLPALWSPLAAYPTHLSSSVSDTRHSPTLAAASAVSTDMGHLSPSNIPIAQPFTSAPLKLRRSHKDTSTSPLRSVNKSRLFKLNTARETKMVPKDRVPIAAAHDHCGQVEEQALQHTNHTYEAQACGVYGSRHHSALAAVQSAVSGPSVPQAVQPSIQEDVDRVMNYLMTTKKTRRKRTPRMIQVLNEGRREGKRIFCTRPWCTVSCSRDADFIRHMQIIHDDRKEICIICGDAVSHMNMRHYCGPNCRASLVERLRRLRSVMPIGDPLQALGLMKERRRR